MAGAKQEAAGIITTTQAAKLLNVTEAWIGKLHKMEYIPKVGRGRWHLVAVVQGYIRFLKDEDRRSSKSAAASRLTDLKAERFEMEMQAERRALVSREDAMLVLDTAATLMQSQMMAVPAKFTRDMPTRRKLESLQAAALGRIADGMDEKAARLADGREIIE